MQISVFVSTSENVENKIDTSLFVVRSNLDIVRFIEVHSVPAVGEHLTAEYYVDQVISDSVEDSSISR